VKRNIIETVMGGVVLAVAAFFLAFAYTTADIQQVEGYELAANFDNIEGLSPGSDVRIGGVKVGTVIGQDLDLEHWVARVRMSIDSSIRLPIDTAAVVRSESLLGGKYMSLEPGFETETIPDGGTISYTQSVPGLEQLLGEVIYSLQQQTGDDGS
jgi:phospholipid/cholesterol/gamma-HCH transport system substrate-binding protein